MELVAAVAHALAVGPADRRPLRGCQRLGDQHVVVDREYERTRARLQWAIGVGGERDAPRRDAAGGGGQEDPFGLCVEPRDGGVLVHAHPGVDACAAQAPREFRGVDDGGAIVDPHAAVIRGRCHLRTHGIAVEHVDVIAMRLHDSGSLDKLLALPRRRRHVDHAGPLEVAVDLVLAHRRLDRVEVLDAEPLEGVELDGKPAQAVCEPVREAGVAEAAVAP